MSWTSNMSEAPKVRGATSQLIKFLHAGSQVLLQPADKLAGVAIQYSTLKYNKNVCVLALLILFIPNKVPIFLF